MFPLDQTSRDGPIALDARATNCGRLAGAKQAIPRARCQAAPRVSDESMFATASGGATFPAYKLNPLRSPQIARIRESIAKSHDRWMPSRVRLPS